MQKWSNTASATLLKKCYHFDLLLKFYHSILIVLLHFRAWTGLVFQQIKKNRKVLMLTFLWIWNIILSFIFNRNWFNSAKKVIKLIASSKTLFYLRITFKYNNKYFDWFFNRLLHVATQLNLDNDWNVNITRQKFTLL